MFREIKTTTIPLLLVLARLHMETEEKIVAYKQHIASNFPTPTIYTSIITCIKVCDSYIHVRYVTQKTYIFPRNDRSGSLRVD